MKKYILTVFSVLFIQVSHAQKRSEYPNTPKDTIVDTYFNTTISDPYQWMENPNDLRLINWKKSQKKIIRKEDRKHNQSTILRAQIYSMFKDVIERKTDEYEKTNIKYRSKYQFDYEYKRSDQFPDLTYRLRGEDNYRTLLKTKDFKNEKKDNIEINKRYVNEEYDLAAIEISHNGSDWREVFFFDLKTGQQMQDTLKYLRAGSNLVWDKKNVYYDRYNEPKAGRQLLDKASGQKLYYHSLGTAQSSDLMLFQNIDTTGTNSFSFLKLENKLFFYHFYNIKGKLVNALSVGEKNSNSFYLKNFLIYPNSNSINFSIEEVFGDTVILKTNWNAPNGKVIKANINQLNKPVKLIPEYDILLKEVNRLGKNKIACIYKEEGKNLALIFNLSGDLLKKMDFREGKKVNGFYENRKEVEYTDFYVSSFYHPNLWYQLSLKDFTVKPATSLSVPYDPESLETRYVNYKSKDGTLIPMYITCLKETKLDGNNPTILYGYGGYGVTIEPDFDETRALWLLHGGVLAIPNVRGGGAKGSEWGNAGKRLNKQNAIDDFISAAEYLIDKNYTSNKKLAIEGGSHGGMLVGAAITQRPNLFKAAIAEAGPMDMLRLGKYTVGSVNTNLNEFGDITNSEDFQNIKSYSPLHNIKKGVRYPNVLLFTGDQDDRVPPFHSYKFMATIQEKGNPWSLYQLYIIPGAGHDGALTPSDQVDKLLYKYYFLFDQLKLKFH